MSLKKYKWKNRILLVETPSYKKKRYIKTINIFKKNIYNFHKRYVKFISKKGLEFKIKLIGFDGGVKMIMEELNPKKVFNTIDDMPMGHLRKKVKPKNLSLYSDYNPETTIKGLGFKDGEKAIFTIEKIKNEPMNYQVRVINTMLHRALNHPNKTKDMEKAIKIFKNWLLKHNNSQSGGGILKFYNQTIKNFGYPL
jgi:hypothetical protein